MSATSQLKIGDSTYSVDDLLAKAEDGTLYDYLEPELSKISGEAEASQLLSDVYDSIEDLKTDYEGMIEGVEEDEDDLDRDLDGDLYEVKKDRYEEEIDDLEELIAELDSTLYVAIQDVVNDYGKFHVRTDADIKFTPTVDYEDGDVIDVQATGGKAEASTDGYDGEDVTGDGLVTYHDYEAFLDSQATARVDGSDQGVFVYLEPEDTVQGMTYSNGVLNMDIYNSRNGKTVTMQISGIMNNVNLYFEYGDESSFPSSVYSHLPSDIKNQMFVNEDIYSLDEQDLERTDAEKLSFIDNYDEIKEGAAAITAQYAASASEALPHVEEGLEIMFGYLNTEAGDTVSLAECMATFIDTLDGLSANVKSDVMVSFIMTMVKEAGQNYFQNMLGMTIPTLIEEVFLEDGALSANEMLACLVIETQTGDSVGKFGGPEILSLTTGVSSSEAGSLANVGGVFFIDNDTGHIAAHSEYWQDEATTREALAAYKSLILEVGWTGNAGAVDDVLFQFDTKDDWEDSAAGSDITSGEATAIKDAKDAFNWGIWDSIGSGITTSNYRREVKNALDVLISGKSYQEAGTHLLQYVQNAEKPRWQDDIMDGVIKTFLDMGDAGKAILDKICEACPGFAQSAMDIINNGNDNPRFYDDTMRYLNDRIYNS
jgi:hypothetical protein